MIISFDQDKREANFAKHGLGLADGGRVLSGVTRDWVDDRESYGEDRWIATGLLNGRVVVCVWAEDGHRFRIISLRGATSGERRGFQAWLSSRRG